MSFPKILAVSISTPLRVNVDLPGDATKQEAERGLLNDKKKKKKKT